MFRGICRSNDYLGNYLYGIVGKEMFTIHDGLNVASDLLLIYGAGYAQQLSNWKQMMDKDELNVADYVIAGQIWTIIVVSSGFKKTGDNEEDVEMIEDGMEVWKEKYGR